MIALVPVVLLLWVQRFRGAWRRGAFIAALALVLLVQLGISEEILATLCFFGAVSWVIFFWLLEDARAALWRLALEILLAAGVTVLLATPFLLALVRGAAEVPSLLNMVALFSTDAVNFLLPTDLMALPAHGVALAARFSGNTSEQGAYLGLPLLLLLGWFFRRRRGNPLVFGLFVIMLGLALCSLGPVLQVGGVKTQIPVLWGGAVWLPLLKAALPGRFNMYVALCAGLAVALFLATPGRLPVRLARHAVALVCVLSLLPRSSAFAWTQWPSQGFFAPQHVRAVLGDKANVIVLPYGGMGPGLELSYCNLSKYVRFWPTWKGL